MWKKYLPPGSTVEFQVGLQGAIIVNAMTGEKQHIGYVGDMPGIVSTFRNLPDRGGTDIRIVATLGTSKQQCNIFLVRNDAPQFKSGKEAVQWMAGKDTSSPHGSCTDRFARLAFKQAGIQPKTYLNQNTIRDIATFQSQLNRQAELIRERIDTINRSLVDVEYEPLPAAGEGLADLVENKEVVAGHRALPSRMGCQHA